MSNQNQNNQARGKRDAMKNEIVQMIRDGFYNPSNSIHQLLPYEVLEVIHSPPYILHTRMLAIGRMPESAPIEDLNNIICSILKDLISVIGKNICYLNDKENNYLLDCAVTSRNNSAIKMLLKAGHRINYDEDFPISHIDTAVLTKNYEAFNIFLRKGASFLRYYANHSGEKPYILARKEFLANTEMQAQANNMYEKLKDAVDLAVDRLCTGKKLQRAKHIVNVFTREFLPNFDNKFKIFLNDEDVHENGCAIRQIIAILPIKWVAAGDTFLVRNGPIMLEGRPTTRSFKMNMYHKMLDFADYDASYGVPAGMFFYLRAEKEVRLQFKMTEQQTEDFDFVAVRIISFKGSGNHKCKTCKKTISQPQQ